MSWENPPLASGTDANQIRLDLLAALAMIAFAIAPTAATAQPTVDLYWGGSGSSVVQLDPNDVAPLNMARASPIRCSVTEIRLLPDTALSALDRMAANPGVVRRGARPRAAEAPTGGRELGLWPKMGRSPRDSASSHPPPRQ